MRPGRASKGFQPCYNGTPARVFERMAKYLLPTEPGMGICPVGPGRIPTYSFPAANGRGVLGDFFSPGVADTTLCQEELHPRLPEEGQFRVGHSRHATACPPSGWPRYFFTTLLSTLQSKSQARRRTRGTGRLATNSAPWKAPGNQPADTIGDRLPDGETRGLSPTLVFWRPRCHPGPFLCRTQKSASLESFGVMQRVKNLMLH